MISRKLQRSSNVLKVILGIWRHNSPLAILKKMRDFRANGVFIDLKGLLRLWKVLSFQRLSRSKINLFSKIYRSFPVPFGNTRNVLECFLRLLKFLRDINYSFSWKMAPNCFYLFIYFWESRKPTKYFFKVGFKRNIRGEICKQKTL